MKYSTHLVDYLQAFGSMLSGVRNGAMRLYAGDPPSDVDGAINGTLVVQLTKAGGALTEEVLSRGVVELTGGGSGSVDGITVDGVQVMSGAENFDADLATTAANVAANINSHVSSPNYCAWNSSAKVIIEAMPGTGTGPNAYVVVSSTTTITTSDTNFGAGGDAQAGVANINGLEFEMASPGVVRKKTGSSWKGTILASGQVGYGIITGSIGENDAADASPYHKIRILFTVGTSGYDYNMETTYLTSGKEYTCDEFTLTRKKAAA